MAPNILPEHLKANNALITEIRYISNASPRQQNHIQFLNSQQKSFF